MRRTTVLLATVLLAMMGAAGCSSDSSDGDPKPTTTKTSTPALPPEKARAACVDAWADALLDDPNLGVDAEPTECEGLPGDDRLDRYMEGLQKRNAINRG
ncbi:hypothetical protein PV382_18080 [Streptomyces scabiei]|uniref:hypothetical protein n=1 Tax=Streptomyces scabiei TaxID=1930 RepID=UPI0029A30642|nr:hypothetical protein [Streptomyces scabiei]MDX3174186.1 hypothetical protein [Streptomyces scabiei]